MIFRVADRNHDEQVSFQEWADFHALFVEPFEVADRSHTYLLKNEDLQEDLPMGHF